MSACTPNHRALNSSRVAKSLLCFPALPLSLFLAVPHYQTVFEKFADYRFKRIVVVDEEARCKGIISVSDLLAYFL